MELRDIAKDWLKENNFDGLYGDDCACVLGNLMPCGDPYPGCIAAFVFRCDECRKEEDCPDTPSGYDWICTNSGNYCEPDYRGDTDD